MKKLFTIFSLHLIPLIFISQAFQPSTIIAKTIFVDDLNDGKEGKGTLEDPFRDLQRAIDLASEKDTIKIQPGKYTAQPKEYIEDLCGNCQNHQTQVKATKGFYIYNKSLILIGSGPDQTILSTQAGYGILFDHSRGSLIKNLKITDGVRDPDGNATDAGIVAKFSTVTITEVEIADNTHQVEGVVVGIGGIFGRENSELFIINNLIANNGWDGVALYRGATAYIADNIIQKGRGAGIGITWDAVATVYRNKLSEYWKGIGSFGDSKAVVRNNLVYDNLGWGIIATGTSTMDASNNIIYHNGNCGFAIWGKEAKGRATNNIIVKNGWRKEWVCPCVGIWSAEKNKNFEVSYNDVWENQAGNYSAGGGSAFGGKDIRDLTGKKGNISLDPKFTDDFRLKSASPLIDQGNPLLTDPDGTISDLGLFGGPNSRR